MTDIDVRLSDSLTPPDERARFLANPVLGESFTDHMAIAQYTPDKGWHDLSIRKVEPFSMHPAAGVLHYAQEIFEGLKAYRREDGSVWLFRPERNAARFAHSARRLSMPPVAEADFLAAVETLVKTEADWVPDGSGERSLYLRPFMIANENFLGVRPANAYTFCVLASPTGPYYPHPVTLWATPNFTRAAPGGTGDAKCGGNYAASLAAATEAKEHGCDQVLWLDGAEHRWVEECGTMNIMFVTADGELLTPQLGTILEGVTRDSVLTLAPDLGLKPVQRRISIDEVFESVADGRIVEVFAVGTAAVVTPVVGFRAPGRDDVVVGSGEPGDVTLHVRERLLDIQFGRVEDRYGWTRRVA